MVDGILLRPTHTQEPTDPDRGSPLANLTASEILDERLLKFSDGLVVELDEFGELSHRATDMDGRGRVRCLGGVEDSTDTLVGLVLPRDVVQHEGPGVEGLDVFRGTEPLQSETDDDLPVVPDEGHDGPADDV